MGGSELSAQHSEDRTGRDGKAVTAARSLSFDLGPPAPRGRPSLQPVHAGRGSPGTGAHGHRPAPVCGPLPACGPWRPARARSRHPRPPPPPRVPGCHLGGPALCLGRPGAALGAAEPAAGFSWGNGVSGRAEVPYLSPRARAPASSPLGASCRGLGPSSWPLTFCPGSGAVAPPRGAGGRDRRSSPRPHAAPPPPPPPAAPVPSAAPSYRRSHPPGEGSGEP